MNREILGGFLIVALILTSSTLCFGTMESENHSMLSCTFSGGGGVMNSTFHRNEATPGQQTPLMNAGNPPYSEHCDLYPGFWYTAFPIGIGPDELAVDFGTLGLYHYDGTALRKISQHNPDGLTSSVNRVVANFPSIGLQEYDGFFWLRLTKNDGQESMCSTGDSLYVDFGSGVGLYKYDGSWSRINANSPEQIWCAGDLLYVDFGAGIGLYSYDGNWSRITKTDPQRLCVIGSVLYIDFGSAAGLYKHDGAWTRINKNTTEALCAVGRDLYADFGAAIGLYKYNGVWTRVSKSDPEGMLSLRKTLYLDFGALGLYKYRGGVMTRINKSNVEAMGSYANKLVVNFPSAGLYEYDGTWKRINPTPPEDMVAADLY